MAGNVYLSVSTQGGHSLTFDNDGNLEVDGAPVGSGGLPIVRTFMVLGPLSVYTFAGFSVKVPSGVNLNLTSVITYITEGTATVTITQQPVGSGFNELAGLTGLSVTTTSSGYITPTDTTPVADQDRFGFELTAVDSSGDIIIDYVFEVA